MKRAQSKTYSLEFREEAMRQLQARTKPIRQFSMLPTAPLYGRCTPADFGPFLRRQVSSTMRTLSLSPNACTTLVRSSSRTPSTS
jgi:hypothetical protein